MTWRSVAVYYALAAALGFHLYGLVRERQPLASPVEQASPVVAAVAADIDLLVARRGALGLQMRRTDGRWVIERPPGASVSSDLIDALLDTLTTIPPVEILGENETEIAKYGLDPPAVELTLRSGESTVAVVQLGARNPTRTAVYARLVDEGRVYLLGLNAQYYLELIYEQVGEQIGSGRRG